MNNEESEYTRHLISKYIEARREATKVFFLLKMLVYLNIINDKLFSKVDDILIARRDSMNYGSVMLYKMKDL